MRCSSNSYDRLVQMARRRTKIRDAKTAEQYQEAVVDRWHKLWDRPKPRDPAPSPPRPVKPQLRERPTFDFDDED